MASNIQRGNTPRPGEKITSQSFGALANATTASKTVIGTTQAGVFTAGGVVFFPVPNSPRPTILRNLFVYDASSGSTPKIGVTPGAYNSIIPTLSGTAISPINPPPAPTLTVGGTDTLIWAEITYNSSNIATSVLFNSGTTLPTATIVPGTAGVDYYSVSTIVVTTGANASVQCLNDFISGNQGYAQCGTTSNCWLK